MLNFIKDLFDEEKKKLRQYQQLVEQINALEPQIQQLNNSELTGQTLKFKEVIAERRSQVAADLPVAERQKALREAEKAALE